jgi:hypothetical protein
LHSNEIGRLFKGIGQSAFVLCVIAIAGCTGVRTSRSLTDDQTNAITSGVRTFVGTVADDLTRRGPAAWRDQFADTPAFFMVADGHLAFANNDDAKRGVEKVAASIAHIELRWGDPIRVDPLTPTLAMLAMPYHEVLSYTTGNKEEASGYFTGLAELGPTGWRFRNAHWSSAGKPPSLP